MSALSTAKTRQPWNKGLLVGQKKPLEPKHVWSIRVSLELAGSKRDLAIFNLAIDSKFRACDLVSGFTIDQFVHPPGSCSSRRKPDDPHADKQTEQRQDNGSGNVDRRGAGGPPLIEQGGVERER